MRKGGEGMSNAFNDWLASIKDGWTDEDEQQWQKEQLEKHEQVYKAVVDVFGHYGIYISWDGDNYRITNNRTLLDYANPDRKETYKHALLLLMQSTMN